MNDGLGPLPRTFAERLRAGRFVMTAEVAPPVSFDAQDLLRKAAPLRGLADAVNVTDGAGARAHMAALAAAAILIEAGIEPILQITCRDKNRIALQSELMGAAALGIRNVMILTGDDPKTGDQPDTTGETPFQYIDGWYMGSFVHRAFKELRREKAAGAGAAPLPVQETEEDLVSR